MTTAKSSDRRKAWTQRQTELRRLLSSKNQTEAALELFFLQHAATHSGDVYRSAEVWSFEDEAMTDLPDDLARVCPQAEINSIVWLLWHAARIEDITLTALVLDQPQVLDRETMVERIGLTTRDVGAGMDESQVVALSQTVSIDGLKAYRAAVGANTKTGLRHLPYECLREIVPAECVYRLAADGSIGPKASWLAEFYLNRSRAWFLTRTATSHNFLHILQAVRLRDKLTHPVKNR